MLVGARQIRPRAARLLLPACAPIPAARRARPRLGAYAIAEGVAVRTGEQRKSTLKVYAQDFGAALRIRHRDGKPLAMDSVAVNWGDIRYSNSHTNAQLDKQGNCVRRLEGPGLWRVRFCYRDSFCAASRVSLQYAPYHDAEAIVAASPLLGKMPPAVLTARRRDPGTLIVQLQDSQGKPAHGFVALDHSHDEPVYAGSTDDHGVIRFEGLQAWGRSIGAYLPGMKLPDLGMDGDPLPADKALVGRFAFYRHEAATALDRETRVEVCPKAVGYIRGVVRPPVGRRAADYKVEWYGRDLIGEGVVNYNAKTGEFVIGPYPVGKQTLKLLASKSSDYNVYESREVVVRRDEVVRVEFKPPAKIKAAEPEPPRRLRGSEQPFDGKVYLPDGKTPAFPALLAYFEPSYLNPDRGAVMTAQGDTDARGEIHHRYLWVNTSYKAPPGSPTEPLLVALLPGKHGAVIVPTEKGQARFKIVLPPAVTLRGKVTVAGKDVSGRNGEFHVLAAYQGSGNVDDVLGTKVSAEADGSFELAGLTPGRCRIQAALDGIWLSKSVEVTIADGAASPAQATLDIGFPGEASIVEVVNAKGKPQPGVELTLERVAGPMASLLWPTQFHADGAGMVHLPPLEAGRHRVRVQGKDWDLVISPLDPDQPQRAHLKVSVQ